MCRGWRCSLSRSCLGAEDMDGDGVQEFLFLAIQAVKDGDPEVGDFYCFNNDGSIRFSVVTGKTIGPMRFGGKTYGPFPVVEYYLTRAASGRKSIVAKAQDRMWFPACVRKLGPNGEYEGEFWHPGHLSVVKDVTFSGRRLLLLGGTSNDHMAAPLIVLDYDNVTGHIPGVAQRYWCETCPKGQPLAYVAFPQMEVSCELKSQPYSSQSMSYRRAIYRSRSCRPSSPSASGRSRNRLWWSTRWTVAFRHATGISAIATRSRTRCSNGSDESGIRWVRRTNRSSFLL